ncbi:hypothetical protein IV37_GL000785 [Fructilactobacillus fructivorans]|uniref:hypothetical protein n=1 Tax=Fructilactobacillus fructivorans TaxID=1614 RepID=UPI00070546B6|nr:hypothetical protein [Fructilactobacillus fructivorans]KRN13146.1 hypothetical protein IV37_GL000785 [Fructilactobacillus fructivorans]
MRLLKSLGKFILSPLISAVMVFGSFPELFAVLNIKASPTLSPAMFFIILIYGIVVFAVVYALFYNVLFKKMKPIVTKNSRYASRGMLIVNIVYVIATLILGLIMIGMKIPQFIDTVVTGFSVIGMPILLILNLVDFMCYPTKETYVINGLFFAFATIVYVMLWWN